MTGDSKMHLTSCAICGTFNNDYEMFPERLAAGVFNPEVFSARRTPDRNHYKIVKCISCGLVRSNPIAPQEMVEQLYASSGFNYSQEIPSLKKTYGRYLKRLEKYGVEKNEFLDIGCGNGFVLEVALSQGYKNISGLEPSRDAVEKADPTIKPHILCGGLSDTAYRDRTFDTLTLFQIFDHIANPSEFLHNVYRLLRPGGLLLLLQHNVNSWSARVLRERSPIYDVEHNYLYSPKTLSMLLNKHGFGTLETNKVFNTYSLTYLVNILPIPSIIKSNTLELLTRLRIARIDLTVPLGNMYVIARKNIT